MKTRIQFNSLGDDSLTEVYDAVSMTQPEMSLSIQEIVEQFAFVGDTPLGMMQFAEPSLREDSVLLESVDLDGLDIAELEELSNNLMERANYLRSLPPAAPPPGSTGEISPTPKE